MRLSNNYLKKQGFVVSNITTKVKYIKKEDFFLVLLESGKITKEETSLIISDQNFSECKTIQDIQEYCKIFIVYKARVSEDELYELISSDSEDFKLKMKTMLLNDINYFRLRITDLTNRMEKLLVKEDGILGMAMVDLVETKVEKKKKKK